MGSEKRNTMTLPAGGGPRTLTAIQQNALRILKSLRALLEERNLRYYIVSGTLLGAVRHRGFIPWDDDIDIAMPREDYDRLIALPDAAFPPPFKLHEITRMPDYYELYAKFVDTSTSITLTEKQRRAGNDKYQWVDVFPLDGLPDNKFPRRLTLLKSGVLKRLYVLSISDAAYKRGIIKTLVIKWFGVFFSSKKIYHSFYKLLSRHPFDTSRDVIFASKLRSCRVYPREVCGRPTKIQFEDDFFNAPENPGAYLRINYGDDYMKMPPEGERRTHKYTLNED